MIRPVVVVVNSMKPFTHASPRTGEPLRGSCKRLFYWVYYKARGHHPPLENVDATDSDKRDELGLCLLGEHPSGQRKLGFDKKVVANLLNSLDKREHLSPVDNTVDNLPTGTPSGGLSMSNF